MKLTGHVVATSIFIDEPPTTRTALGNPFDCFLTLILGSSLSLSYSAIVFRARLVIMPRNIVM